MNKYIFIILVFFCCVCSCQIESRYCSVYARNMMTVSDVFLFFGPAVPGIWTGEEIYLPACPAGGEPIEKKSGAYYQRGDDMRWQVVKAIGDTIIGSGAFTMENKRLEVDSTNGDWTCTWSDEALW